MKHFVIKIYLGKNELELCDTILISIDDIDALQDIVLEYNDKLYTLVISIV